VMPIILTTAILVIPNYIVNLGMFTSNKALRHIQSSDKSPMVLFRLPAATKIAF